MSVKPNESMYDMHSFDVGAKVCTTMLHQAVTFFQPGSCKQWYIFLSYKQLLLTILLNNLLV
jgi:hypothetical protein